ncbi:MAG: hypothetical protein ABI600_05300 [Luteolibacter sp.]
MSAAPREPENYSIDEMMDRLKKPSTEDSEEDGELVVRADGTQAIRIRKRKRRTAQPVKQDAIRLRRSRIMQVAAAMVLVILAGLTIGTAVIYANSPPFREALIQKIALSTGATSELQMFRMNPKTANANSLSLKWPEGNMLNSLSARGIIAEIFPSSFFGKSMKGEEITTLEATLALQIPKPTVPSRTEASPSGGLPIQFNRYRAPVFHMTMGNPSAPAIRLYKSEASLYPNTLNGRTQFSLNQGQLTIKGWPKLRLDRAFMEFRSDEIDIVGLRVQDETDNRGVFEFSGTIVPYNPDQLSTLSVRLDSFPLAGITSPALGKLFSGRIDSLPAAKSNYLAFYPSENPSAKLAISFQCALTSNMEVTGFPFLFALSQTLEDDWFQRPIFEGEGASGTILREAETVSLQDLNFENKGRMALRGRISMAANQALTGNLEVGVAEAMINTAITSRLKTLFGPTKEGFRWVTLKIGGSASNPTDNFKELFLAPEATRTGKDQESDQHGSTFEELTQPR